MANVYTFSRTAGRFMQEPRSGAYRRTIVTVMEVCDRDTDMRYYRVRETVGVYTVREVRLDTEGYFDLRSGLDTRAREIGAEWLREAQDDTARRRAAGEFLISIN